MTTTEAARVMNMAIGRLFRLASRPAEPDDTAAYFACRAAVLDAAEVLGLRPSPPPPLPRPGWNFGNRVVD